MHSFSVSQTTSTCSSVSISGLIIISSLSYGPAYTPRSRISAHSSRPLPKGIFA